MQKSLVLAIFCTYLTAQCLAQDPETVFTSIYQNNSWGNTESVSGPGSTLKETIKVRELIPALLQDLGIRVFLDAPCGDFNWLKHVEFPFLDQYIGIDIVAQIIERNAQLYTTDQRSFAHGSILADALPRADLIMCRDCLVHFPFKEIWTALANFKASGARYLLTTTFPGCRKNKDLYQIGMWRPINLELPPFNFPQPVAFITEELPTSNPVHATKTLAVWEIKDLPL